MLLQSKYLAKHNLSEKGLFRYKVLFPRATSYVTISQVVTSQMCNFPSGNSPNVRRFSKWQFQVATSAWRKNGIFPMKEVSNEYLSFISLKEFLNFLKENIRNLK